MCPSVASSTGPVKISPSGKFFVPSQLIQTRSVTARRRSVWTFKTDLRLPSSQSINRCCIAPCLRQAAAGSSAPSLHASKTNAVNSVSTFPRPGHTHSSGRASASSGTHLTRIAPSWSSARLDSVCERSGGSDRCRVSSCSRHPSRGSTRLLHHATSDRGARARRSARPIQVRADRRSTPKSRDHHRQATGAEGFTVDRAQERRAETSPSIETTSPGCTPVE